MVYNQRLPDMQKSNNKAHNEEENWIIELDTDVRIHKGIKLDITMIFAVLKGK